jgi:anaerobic ribonucleoside-triphosphate reductase activating protein
LGGEPLCEQNAEDVLSILSCVKMAYPFIKIFLWTGYTYEYLLSLNSDTINGVLSKVDVLIDGPFIEEQRDVSLYLRGSHNQRVIDLKQMRENHSKEIILIDKK